MSNAASAQAVEIGKEKLRDFLESSETGRQAMAMSSSSSSSERRDGFAAGKGKGRGGVRRVGEEAEEREGEVVELDEI